MPLSWNEIKTRAVQFSRTWENTHREEADAKPFLDDFFEVFGISRRKTATFEQKVKKLDGSGGFIDLLWKGMFLVEMKSRGKDLNKAFDQAKAYCQTLKPHELPRAILVCDFQKFRLHSLEDGSIEEFSLDLLRENVHRFGWLIGYQKREFKDEDPVNIEAAERMGRLHDAMLAVGYEGHALEVYLVRVLFCLFAEDTGIFEARKQFQDFIELKTGEDGSDLAARLAELFQILNTPADRRLKNLDETMAAFPYVNGRLFEENLPFAAFDSAMRQSLLECCWLDWSKISPAIFGSMFQAVMDKTARRNLGAHYTSEKNILKLIRPLFLDGLRAEFEKLRQNRPKLLVFHQKLAGLRFLDPACGCGNFLLITYRELRLLEIDVLRELQRGQQVLDIGQLVRVDVDQFFGIEIDEFAVRIAEVAMWLTDHQMNGRVSDEFGQYFVRLPLRKAARIVHGNSLRIDWETVCPAAELSFILGNPPFVGAKFQSEQQRADMNFVLEGIESGGLLDFVAGWYIKAARFIENTPIVAAFVSTNSITQGEQVAPLWGFMFRKNIKIHFAYRTFPWSNEARGNAAVHCVIIGFGHSEAVSKTIFHFENATKETVGVSVSRINPYLIDAPDTLIGNRQHPLSSIPKLVTGNKPIDGGHFIFLDAEKDDFLKKEPGAAKFMLPFIGAEEFINGGQRWILYLKNASPSELRQLPEVLKRIEAVRKVRLESKSLPTKKLAETPTLFHTEAMPAAEFLIIPQTTSERRAYLQLGFQSPPIVCSDKLRLLENANLYLFGVLSSKMKMAWVKAIGGRLKSDYSYSVNLIYNNYPFPPAPSEKQKQQVETAAQQVLDARAAFPTASLADLYDPLSMPPALVKAHQALDKAVDNCYRSAPFTSEMQRIEYLFGLYEGLTNPLGLSVAAAPKKGKGKK